MSTYTPIASVTLSSAQSSVTFSGIPQTYTDLVLVVNSTSNTGANSWIRCNGDTGTNYSYTVLYGTGSAAGSARDSNKSEGLLMDYYGNPSSTQPNTTIVQFNNYSNTTTYKTSISRANRADGGVDAVVSLWRSTSAITSLTLRFTTATYSSGSTFNLYGVANASITNVAKATGGDSVYTDGTYWYHIFRSSGTFTPTQALTADYLVVAGGGGGGGNVDGSATSSGGGGAGGLRCTVGATGGGGSLESALSLTASTNYTVTIGAGGAAGDYNAGQQYGGDGSNSVFSSITSTGGGGGGYVPGTGRNGGSGGGGYAANGGGTGTANQGFNGAAGGGGGAGEAGGTDSAREGGDGVATSISGTSVTYAGGGGGGNGYAGGNGGGGAGGTTGNGVAGTANLGGGGGGAYQGGGAGKLGGAGGSGIVIVRYGV